MMLNIGKYRSGIMFAVMGILTIISFLCCLFVGSVDIPVSETLNALLGNATSKPTWGYIILESRLPMAITAVIAGAALSVSGLLLQTTFQNPLAGPSILGVSTGASMGVAVITLGAGGIIEMLFGQQAGFYISNILGAIIGAGLIICTLLAFSSIVKDVFMLLIVGILISHLSSSMISLLNFFSSAEEVKSFVVWGLGSFAGVTSSNLPIYSIISIILLVYCFTLVKPLNALLLGERYAKNMGYSMKVLRSKLLIVSGCLTAVVTAFCGPIGFIGLIVPHVARLMLNTSNHVTLLPATMLCGGLISLFCTFISVLPASIGVIPINAITPIIGVPIIIYVIINRKRINYFN